MDKFQEMRVFAAVVDAGSFVGCSDALDMSKPAVSRYVANPKTRLGVRLLHSTTRRHVLPKARLLIDYPVEAFKVKPWAD